MHPENDVSLIRRKTRRTQASFARLIGVRAGTIRSWEHGRRTPTGAARALLRLIETDPEIVEGLMRRAGRVELATLS